jgi:hypothetical protein
MKKGISLLLCLILVSGAVFAAASQTIGLGAGFATAVNKDDSDQKLSYSGFDLSVAGFTKINTRKNLVLYEDIDLAFPTKIKSGNTTIDKDDNLKATKLDVILGVGYQQSLKDIPLSFAVGGGVYLNNVKWSIDTSSIGSLKNSYSVLTLGLSAFANLRFDCSDNIFVDLTLTDCVGFYNKATAKLGSSSSTSDSNNNFSNDFAGRIGVGYRFDFK